jgi:hypothetical protein
VSGVLIKLTYLLVVQRTNLYSTTVKKFKGTLGSCGLGLVRVRVRVTIEQLKLLRRSVQSSWQEQMGCNTFCSRVQDAVIEPPKLASYHMD